MRFDRLHILRYGALTGRELAFRPDARLHVVFGRNEAGKTSILSAISDLLFGFRDVGEDPLAALEERLAFGREGEASRRAVQQAHAEPILQARDQFRDRRGREAQVARRGREATALHRAHERDHVALGQLVPLLHK